MDLKAATILAYCHSRGYPLPEPEYRFAHAQGRRFRLDLAWWQTPKKWALEFEGGVWTRGRHIRPRGFVADIEKYNLAALLGYFVLRCTPEQVESGAAFGLLDAAFGRKDA
jgi:hypothetical protein